MTTALCYFSGTGNCLYAAQTLASSLGDCTLIKLYDALKNISILEKYDRVGLIFPVYSMSLPEIVFDFVNMLDADFAGKYFFALICGGGLNGDCSVRLAALMDENAVLLSYSAYITMPYNNIITLPAPSARVIESTLSIAARRLSVVAADISVRMVQKPSFGVRIPKKIGGLFAKSQSPDARFILTAACDGCGKCADICPVRNIKMQSGKPVFEHSCQLCLGCLSRCPQGAINYGRKTIKKPRYINPLADFDEQCD